MGFDRSKRSAFGVMLLAIALSSEALAQPNEGPIAAARAFMTEGRARRANHDTRAALESFRSADAIMHVPSTGIEVARTQVALGLLVEARKTLDELMARDVIDDEPVQFTMARLAATKLSDELAKRIPKVRISVTGLPPKTPYTVWCDGTLVDPAESVQGLSFNPGKHTVVVRAESAESKQFIDIEEGQTRDIVLDMGLDIPEPVAPQPKETPRSSVSVSPIVYVLGATAAVSLGAAGVFALLERKKGQELGATCSPRCTEQDIAPARQMLQAANASLVVGVASATTAVIWYLVDKPGRSAQKISIRRVVPFDVQPTDGGTMLLWSGSF